MRADDLGHFLRTRRQRLDPVAVGLPGGQNRRTSGLRREEVAVLAGIGVSWLTRIEQGRANRVSADVLSGLGRALRLTGIERAHLFSLAGIKPPVDDLDREVSDSHRRLLDGLDPHPAYLLDQHWDLVAWNRSEAELFPPLESAGRAPNLLRLVLDNPAIKSHMGDWPGEVARLAREFRAHVTDFPSEAVERLADELLAAHPVFADAWSGHDVSPAAPHVRRVHHPDRVQLFEQHRLALPDHPGWTLVVFVPLDRAGGCRSELAAGTTTDRNSTESF